MINWIKFYFFGFFIHNEAKDARKRSFWNVILTLFIYVLIVPIFQTLAFTSTFSYHLNNATTFNQEIFQVFYNDTNRLSLDTSEYINGSDTNTYASIIDKNNDNNLFYINTYKTGKSTEYDFIIDTRETNKIFVEYTLNAKNSTTEDTISLEEYYDLSSTEKKNYKINYVLTDKEISIDNELLETIESYFLGLEEGDSYRTNYQAILDSKSTYTDVNLYNHDLYAYYLLCNFGTLMIDSTYSSYIVSDYKTAISKASSLPTLSNHYYNTYVSATDKSGDLIYKNVIIFTNSYNYINFTTDKDINISYMGYYNELGNDFKLIYNDQVISNKTECATRLTYIINQTFQGSSSIYAIQRFLAIVTTIPTLLIFVVISAFLMYLLNKITHQIYGQKFLGSFKIISSFIFISSIITSFSSFITSFFMDAAKVLNFSFALVLLVIFIRTLVFIIYEYVLFKKDPLHDEEKVETIHLDPISNVGASGVRVIDNSSNDDEAETMEMM